MTPQEADEHDLPFSADPVGGRALALLRRNKSEPRPGEIHLDIGCGCGRIAEHFQSELGKGYVGLSDVDGELSSLAQRGFEMHRIQFEGPGATLRQLEEIIANRTVGSITFLDKLANLADGDGVLQAVAEIARRHRALVVVSAANVAHRDIGAKLAFGRWNYTETGLLDHGSLRLFNQSTLLATLEKAGLPVIDRRDLVTPLSDQHFPATHTALAAGTTLNGLLFDIARQANPCSDVDRFICLCAPSREMARETFLTVREEPRPLVSVIIRTQGRRLHTLVEALLCLSGQTDSDFEVFIVGHKLEPERFEAVQGVIDDTQEWLRRKIRLLPVEDGGRARPLNIGFAAANGRYIAILDDDDVPFGNWIEEYRKLDAQSPGSILRSVAVRQNVVNVAINGKTGLRAVGPPERSFPAEYDFLTQLVENQSPNNTLAFPRGAFHDLGLRFDESLDTMEDWDFLLRVSAYCGVVSSPTVTGVYRWWSGQEESSRTAHNESEWRANYEAILRKQDQSFFIVPKGGLGQIRRLVHDYRALSAPKISPKPTPAPEPEPEAEPGLESIDDAIYWGHKLANEMPHDLVHAMRRGLSRKCFSLRARIFFSVLSKQRRRRLRRRLTIFQSFLKSCQ